MAAAVAEDYSSHGGYLLAKVVGRLTPINHSGRGNKLRTELIANLNHYLLFDLPLATQTGVPASGWRREVGREEPGQSGPNDKNQRPL